MSGHTWPGSGGCRDPARGRSVSPPGSGTGGWSPGRHSGRTGHSPQGGRGSQDTCGRGQALAPAAAAATVWSASVWSAWSRVMGPHWSEVTRLLAALTRADQPHSPPLQSTLIILCSIEHWWRMNLVNPKKEVHTKRLKKLKEKLFIRLLLNSSKYSKIKKKGLHNSSI